MHNQKTMAACPVALTCVKCIADGATFFKILIKTDKKEK